MSTWSKDREALLKEAAANLQEAVGLLAAEKRASQPANELQVKQAMLANIHRNLKYADFCDALVGAR